MDNIDSILIALTIAAGAALWVERSLEYLKIIVERGYGVINEHSPKIQLDHARRMNHDAKLILSGSPSPLAERNVQDLSPSYSPDTATVSIPDLVALERQAVADDVEQVEQFEPPDLPVMPATPCSAAKAARTLFYQLTGAALGIILAQLMGLRLLALFLATPTGGLIGFLDIVFTGIVIGGGSQPIHIVIRFISERRSDTVALENPEEAERDSPVAPVLLNATGKPLRDAILANALVEPAPKKPPPLMPIIYTGGLNIEALESTHIRTLPVNRIVYHHTGTSSNASFEHLVNELIVKKGALTAYHCVVMPDGELNFICRWDRYGSHAKGVNMSSLGLAFLGNFHSAPGDRFSNADGRFGNQVPTELQLNAGARLIALWVHLYSHLALDFNQQIIPHHNTLQGYSVCPGSNFPHAQLQMKVREHFRFWTRDFEARSQLAAFRNSSPYIFAEGEKI